MQAPLMVDTDSEATPKEPSEWQLTTLVPCPLLRVLRNGMIAAPNDTDAAETGVPGEYDSSRYFTFSPLLGLLPCSIEVISTLAS
jgi:hypothetical protein